MGDAPGSVRCRFGAVRGPIPPRVWVCRIACTTRIGGSRSPAATPMEAAHRRGSSREICGALPVSTSTSSPPQGARRKTGLRVQNVPRIDEKASANLWRAAPRSARRDPSKRRCGGVRGRRRYPRRTRAGRTSGQLPGADVCGRLRDTLAGACDLGGVRVISVERVGDACKRRGACGMSGVGMQKGRGLARKPDFPDSPSSSSEQCYRVHLCPRSSVDRLLVFFSLESPAAMSDERVPLRATDDSAGESAARGAPPATRPGSARPVSAGLAVGSARATPPSPGSQTARPPAPGASALFAPVAASSAALAAPSPTGLAIDARSLRWRTTAQSAAAASAAAAQGGVLAGNKGRKSSDVTRSEGRSMRVYFGEL